MGLKLSDMGCLTFSQKKSCGGDKKQEAALFTKLSRMEMNKPILEEVKHKAENRKLAARARLETVAKAKAGRSNR